MSNIFSPVRPFLARSSFQCQKMSVPVQGKNRVNWWKWKFLSGINFPWSTEIFDFFEMINQIFFNFKFSNSIYTIVEIYRSFFAPFKPLLSSGLARCHFKFRQPCNKDWIPKWITLSFRSFIWKWDIYPNSFLICQMVSEDIYTIHSRWLTSTLLKYVNSITSCFN